VRISFENEELREICLKSEVAANYLDIHSSENLKTRLSELRSAENFQEEVINYYIQEQVEGKLYKIDLGKFNLYLVPVNKPLHFDEAGKLIRSHVTRLKVVDIK
tara:strand:+ start:3032 stop:3343 length:312 start_codon:yes stop_codon:yes gene_type:complete